jgi:peptidyl-tRNA hydrolase
MGETVAVESKVSGHRDPAGEPPWVMQLVACVPKADPPSHSAVCAAAATAVVSLLADPRAQPGGEWAAEVQRWSEGRIRKHVRRARGAAWDRAAALPGVSVTVGSATVRAFVPCPVSEVPAELARCQLSGLDLADPDPGDGTAAPPSPLVTVSLSADPVLSTGKAAAAAGHAAQLAWWSMDPDARRRWRAAGFAVTVELPDPVQWTQRVMSAQVVVSDAGFTEVEPHTVTATASWNLDPAT